MFRDFYPEKDAFHSEFLKVSDLHTIYFEQSGNPKGTPILFLHGGPGGGISPDHRRFFHPEKYRAILFDQRGCGKSTPFAELRENTTWDLVEDIEKLRKHLGLQKWHVFGGSWGSTLALAYAQTYPENVSALILRGIFLCRRSELLWLYQAGASQVFPDFWKPFEAFIPPSERSDFIQAYHRRLVGSDEALKLKAAQLWSQWEASASCLHVKQTMIDEYGDPYKALPFARIEAHYFVNGGFLKQDTQLLDGVSKVRNIPAVIVQGRYDMVCPMQTAYELHQAWPESKFVVVPDAGHSAFEPGIRSALIQACDEFVKSGSESVS